MTSASHKIITRVPVLIGDGIPLFGTLPHDERLRHVATRHYPSGLVQSEAAKQSLNRRSVLGDRQGETRNVQD
jgi:dihydrofolate reductase